MTINVSAVGLVRPLHGCLIRRLTASGTIYAGDAVYIYSDGTIRAADASAVASVLSAGIAVSGPNGATTISSGMEVDVVFSGPVTGWASMTPGTLAYIDHSAAGGLLATAGTKSFIMGVWLSATTLLVRPETVALS
jgi:hypothetical protein